MLLQTGIIRLALLALDGTKVKTLFLPPPAPDGVNLGWVKKSSTAERVDGADRTRLLGFVPELTCKWNAYDDRPGQGWTIGAADGNRPGLEDLLVLLSQPTGLIRVSPGPAAAGFTCDSIDVQPIGKQGAIFTGLQVVFHGRDILQTMTLEGF